MADLKKSKEEWQQFLGRELGTFLACLLELQELEDKYSRARIRVAVLNDPFGNVGTRGVVLAGVDLGRNTSIDGALVARVVGVVDPRRIALYRAPGALAQELMAEGAGPAGSIVPLAERNNSGLSGTWDLAARVVEDTTDRLRLLPVPDWHVRVAAVWSGASEKEARAREDFLLALRTVAVRLQDARLVVRDALAAFATRLGGRGAEFLGTTSAALAVESTLRDPSGAVGRRRTGFLPTLARAMAEDTRAGEQSVTERLLRASAGVFARSNDGQGRVGVHVPREFCPAARWVFRCVRGKDTGHGGREEFECTATIADEDRQVAFAGVRIKQSFAGPDGIGPFTLERVATKTGDPQDDFLSPADALVTSGERDQNTEGGILYWRVEKTVTAFDVSFFRSANRTLGELVAKAEATQPNAPFQATERTASGLDVKWRLGPRPVHGAEGALDLNFFVTENAAGIPDEFEITTEVVTQGRYQALVAEQLGAHLHSKPAGQASMSDGWAVAGTVLPFFERS